MKWVFFLEELSAREMLKGLLPRVLPKGSEACYVVFEGKQDLEKQLPRKLRGWLEPNTRFVVLRDRDGGKWPIIKKRLQALCEESGKPDTLIRIACREIESWYLGDLQAVEKGLGVKDVAKLQNSAKYRTPDKLENPVQELGHITKSCYQKVAGSRSIGHHLDPDNNLSCSFSVFISGIRESVS